MHFFKYCVLLKLVFFCFAACTNQAAKDKRSDNSTDTAVNSILIRKGWDVEPLLRKSDSIQVLFFDDPYGDSLRYTRYYRYISVSDTSLINLFVNQFDTLFKETNVVNKQCRSEGKIIVYAGAEPVKTVYFSTGRIDTCSYLYFIKDGAFYYFTLSPEMKTTLTALKIKSKKP